MSNQLRDISVEKEIYCEMFEVEPTGVSDQLIHAFFERRAAEHLELLKTGYQQMADINAKITQDFTSCEAACEEHVFNVLSSD